MSYKNYPTGQSPVEILRVKIDCLPRPAVLSLAKEWLEKDGFHQLTTVNPEFALAAEHDEEFFHLLNQADLNVPDGVGLVLAAWLKGEKLHRYPGADLMLDLLAWAEKQKLSVAFVHWSGSHTTSESLAKGLQARFPALNFIISLAQRDGHWSDPDFEAFCARLVFVSLGAPEQEKFIYHNLLPLGFVHLAIGIGGAVDFLSGRVQRAPALMRRLGLEWLWRLFCQPRRWRRIFNATVLFFAHYLRERFLRPFFYRPNVACLLFKKEYAKYYILIFERADESGHWQIPQGGRDGQGAAAAGLRELGEELNTDKFRLIRAWPEIHRYNYSSVSGQRGRSGWRGQKQSLMVAEFLGTDQDIRLNDWEYRRWRWIGLEDLLAAVHPLRKPGMIKFIACFQDLLKQKII